MKLRGELEVEIKIILEADVFLHQIIAMSLKAKLYIFVRVIIHQIKVIINLKTI